MPRTNPWEHLRDGPREAPEPTDPNASIYEPQLRSMRGWMKALSVFGFLVTIWLGFGGIGAMMMPEAIEGMEGVNPEQVRQLGIVLFALTPIFFFLSLHLWKSVRTLDEYLAQSNPDNLSAFLQQQSAFWRSLGVFALLLAAFVVISTALGVGQGR